MVSLTAPSSSRRNYDAFISYSHAADLLVARAVEQGLQQLAKPWYQRRALRRRGSRFDEQLDAANNRTCSAAIVRWRSTSS
jgi:hypothetical protein